jgi:hypothetical protein
MDLHSDFEEMLGKERAARLPAFPPRKVFGAREVPFLVKRTNELNAWLEKV